MAQSVELLLDAAAEQRVRAEWDALADAGLPSERRATPSDTHRPHVTLWAGDRVSAAVDEALLPLGDDLELSLRLGSVLCFPARTGYVLVRSVLPSVPLLALQAQVLATCGPGLGDQFQPGRWAPHVTLARRVPAEAVGTSLELIDGAVDTRSTHLRRWDGQARRAWLLTTV